MLANFVTEKTIISFPECITQLYFSVFTIAECHMLAVMAYHCYVIICNPLFYNVTVSYQVCLWMVVCIYGMGLVGATANTVCENSEQ
jgi:olfactory receptor